MSTAVATASPAREYMVIVTLCNNRTVSYIPENGEHAIRTYTNLVARACQGKPHHQRFATVHAIGVTLIVADNTGHTVSKCDSGEIPCHCNRQEPA